MSSSIRVSNLPTSSDKELLHSLFLSFGPILVITAQSNYIDIQFQDIEDSQAALDNMNGYKLGDRYLQVSRIGEINPLDSLENRKALWDQNHELNTETE